MKYYAAYGSNLNVLQMLRRCPGAKPVGISELKDHRLLFRGSKTGNYLTVEYAKGYSVPLVIWKVSEENERSLDIYEGYPTFYTKKEITLILEGKKKKKVKGFIYLMQPGHPVGVPTAMYYQTCLSGYRSFGLIPKPLNDAYWYSRMMAEDAERDAIRWPD